VKTPKKPKTTDDRTVQQKIGLRLNVPVNKVFKDRKKDANKKACRKKVKGV
jgi:hypothetical protein